MRRIANMRTGKVSTGPDVDLVIGEAPPPDDHPSVLAAALKAKLVLSDADILSARAALAASRGRD